MGVVDRVQTQSIRASIYYQSDRFTKVRQYGPLNCLLESEVKLKSILYDQVRSHISIFLPS